MAKVVAYDDFSTLVAASDMQRLMNACVKHNCCYALHFDNGKYMIRVGNNRTGDSMSTADRRLCMVILSAKNWFEENFAETFN